MRNYELDEVYTAREVARICGISEGRVRYWIKTRSSTSGPRIHFEDLLRLLAKHVPNAVVNRSMYPPVLELNEYVRIIPGMNSGRPSVAGSSIDAIMARYWAGESHHDIAVDLGLTMEQVNAAIKWDTQ